MMIMRTPLLLTCLICFSTIHHVTAQNGTGALPAQSAAPYSATPAHMWEFGLHGGVPLLFSDIDPSPNWGVGLHVRRAIDYVFSIRLDGFYGIFKNEDTQDGSVETTMQSGSLDVVVSMNNLIWSANKNRKSNLYALVGGGVTQFDVEIIKAAAQVVPVDMWLTHANAGLGLSFRLSDRFNLGFESKAIFFLGKNADMLEGVARRSNDVGNYSSARLNFNLGNKEKLAEPLYWLNPMDVIVKDITELKARPQFDLTDKDGDGVIDILDQDPSTPPNVAVDTRGIALDSDGDGVPNHLDDDPYVAKGRKYAEQGNRPFVTEDDVKRIVNGELRNFDPSETGGGAGGSLANWFLPMVHFNIDSYKVRYADYGNFSSIAKVLKGNPNLKIVVTGFTDNTASADYNLDLSYKRAKTAIEHLANIHGIARNRLILQYNGEQEPLVPSTGSNIMNRRVEFRVANNADEEMGAPGKS